MNEQINRAADPELICVREAFAEWRHSRSGARPQIPLELKSLAVGLLASRSLRSVADALRVNCNVLRDWRDQGIMPTSGDLRIKRTVLPTDDGNAADDDYLAKSANKWMTHAAHCVNTPLTETN